MKNLLSKLVFVPFILAIIWGVKINSDILFAKAPHNDDPALTQSLQPLPTATTNQARIQVALLLDVSGSMDGLLSQARNQIWNMVNELAQARFGEEMPQLELALYSYGEAGSYEGTAYLRRLQPFTTDLDAVSEVLFALRTSGSNEHCGQVIQLAVSELAWSDSPDDLHVMFIAGNEEFTQGPIPFRQAIQSASAKNITVNTIFCGPKAKGEGSGWLAAANLSYGRFMNIDQDKAVAVISSPYDAEIDKLNTQLNGTYLSYGTQNLHKCQTQARQDDNSKKESAANISSRAQSKLSGYYKSDSWDMVDAAEENEAFLDTVSLGDITLAGAVIEDKDREEVKALVKEKAAERKQIKKDLARNIQMRNDFVTAENIKNNVSTKGNLDAAMIQTITVQAKKKNFRFVKK